MSLLSIHLFEVPTTLFCCVWGSGVLIVIKHYKQMGIQTLWNWKYNLIWFPDLPPRAVQKCHQPPLMVRHQGMKTFFLCSAMFGLFLILVKENPMTVKKLKWLPTILNKAWMLRLSKEQQSIEKCIHLIKELIGQIFYKYI